MLPRRVGYGVKRRIISKPSKAHDQDWVGCVCGKGKPGRVNGGIFAEGIGSGIPKYVTLIRNRSKKHIFGMKTHSKNEILLEVTSEK
jgi:hypothetical protein